VRGFIPRDPSTSVLCIAYAVDDEPVQLLTAHDLREGSDTDFDLTAFSTDPDTVFFAHNAFFERSIWKNIMEKRYGFPPIPLQRWRCTQAKACAYGLPKALEKATLALGLSEHKDAKGHQVMLRLSKPISNKKGEIKYDDDPEKFRQLYEYCKQDVRTERELDNSLPDLSDAEQEIWFYDQLINTRGIHVDMPTVKNFVTILESKTASLNQELVAITDGEVTKGTQRARIVDYINKDGVIIPDLTKDTVSAAIESGTLTPNQIQVLRLRQQLGKSSLAKYKKLTIAVDENNVLRDNFVYHGASTGRWSGKMVQLQNLPKNTAKIDTHQAIDCMNTYGYPAVEFMYPSNLMDVMSSCIRGLFVPDEGKELLIVDYGAIEARIVMWLAEDATGLKEFEATDKGKDEDIYVKMAQRIYNDLHLTKATDPDKRQLGKQAILGCGFGMAAKKFVATCAGYGIDIFEPEAKRIVDLYRTTYYCVKNYWADVQQTMMNAFYAPNTIQTLRHIKWVYKPEAGAMFCQLPSGRVLTYMRPKLGPNRFGQPGMSFMTEVNSQWVRRDVYGGLLVENCVQATARDIMTANMPSLELAGFPILMHTHDEIVSERPIGEGKIQEMIDIMCKIPEWATGCPIVAEGFTSPRYKKG